MNASTAAAPLRYVALGDSLSEGVGDDPWPDGTARGWTDRLATMFAQHYREREVQYANLAVRGYKAAQVRDSQLTQALGMRPDVVTLTAGMNDVLRPRVDFEALQRTLIEIVAPFTEVGVLVVVVPIPDLAQVSVVAPLINARRLRLNGIYQQLCNECGVLPLVDTTGTVFEDPRAWHEDRLHLSSLGHERLACAAASSLGIPVEPDWLLAPAGPAAPRTIRTESAWFWNYARPWIGRRIAGRSSGDGRVAKRPTLGAVSATLGN